MRESVTWSGLSGVWLWLFYWPSSPMVEWTVSACKTAGGRREKVMNRWRDFRRGMRTELLLLAYMIAWVIALLLTHMLTE